jgi:hypothetical protein
MSGVGKTTAARAFAFEHDLWLYSLDARTYEHDAELPSESKSLDERWVDTTPERLARDAILAARIRASASTVVEISGVVETATAVESRFHPLIAEWLARTDHGDVDSRRRYDRKHACDSGGHMPRRLPNAIRVARHAGPRGLQRRP